MTQAGLTGDVDDSLHQAQVRCLVDGAVVTEGSRRRLDVLDAATESLEAAALAGRFGCEEEDVCGVTKSICTQGDAQVSYATLKGYVDSGAYPLFFCESLLFKM